MQYMNLLTGNEVIVKTQHYDHAIEQAVLASKKSKDKFSKVGCVVTDKNFVTISTGYNGPNRKAVDERFNFDRTGRVGLLTREYNHLNITDKRFTLLKNPFMVHAEINALVNCTNRNAFNDALVFLTHYTCVSCLNTLIQANVRQIIVQDNKHSAYQEMLPELLYLLENSKIPENFYLVQVK